MSGLFKSKLPPPPKPTEIPDSEDVAAKRKSLRKGSTRGKTTNRADTNGGNFTRGTLG